MKVGDKLYCYKYCEHLYITYIKGKEYTIKEITPPGNFMLSDAGYQSWFTPENIKKHFYTLQEVRKLKLDKLK